MLGNSLDPDTMRILRNAQERGIPFFVNPYYLSLLHVRVPHFAIGADPAIRDYVVYSSRLVEEFGHIVAWEKEDQVEAGQPNAAGWLLPSGRNVHRRYPDVAILIPDSMGRACGGLCASCQRMYDFQSGRLNFDLDKLRPTETWPQKLERLLEYWEQDSQLRDILITGGDSLMSTDGTLQEIFEAICRMAARKRDANRARPNGDKHAEIVRVRLGTRLPVYLPQRITPELAGILADFKDAASAVGIQQFFIQTHFESPMEITPEARQAVDQIADLRARANIPFLATDKSVPNLPGVGKSLSFRVIGITRYGRRVLEFDHDRTRSHSPIVETLGKVVVIESKSISEYLRQLEEMGEDAAEYRGVYGYSIGVTEPRMPLYEYPDYGFAVTREITNLELERTD